MFFGLILAMFCKVLTKGSLWLRAGTSDIKDDGVVTILQDHLEKNNWECFAIILSYNRCSLFGLLDFSVLQYYTRTLIAFHLVTYFAHGFKRLHSRHEIVSCITCVTENNFLFRWSSHSRQSRKGLPGSPVRTSKLSTMRQTPTCELSCARFRGTPTALSPGKWWLPSSKWTKIWPSTTGSE